MANHSRGYKSNHYIPRFMLDYWATDGDRYRGVHTYERETKRKNFSYAKGRRSFAFAAVDNLYVPIVDGIRVTSLEKWFGYHETPLASLIRQIQGKKELTVCREDDVTLIQMAIHAMDCRSRYDISKIIELLSENEEYVYLLGESPGFSLHRLVLENIVTATTEMFGRLNPLEIRICHVRSGSLLIGDRPCIRSGDLPCNILVLTNRVAILYSRSTDSRFRYIYEEMDDDLRDCVNEMIALNSRDWLVADNENLLDKYIPLLHSPRWQESQAAEALDYLEPTSITSGYRIAPIE